MRRQQLFIRDRTITLNGGNSTYGSFAHYETGGVTSIAYMWTVGVILILCLLIPVIHAVRTKLGHQQLQANQETSAEEQQEGRGISEQQQQIDPCLLLDKYKITLKETHFQSPAMDDAGQPSVISLSKGGSSASLTSNEGCEDDAVHVESTPQNRARDAASVGTNETKETDDDDSILDLEEGTFKQVFLRVGGEDETKNIKDLCAICLSSYNVDETIVYLPLCEHAYHYDCMKQVVPRDSKCPLCRRDLILPKDSTPTERLGEGRQEGSMNFTTSATDADVEVVT